jgi:serine/threonine protein kinase/tetratricopeptide (TPR) repeat protein
MTAMTPERWKQVKDLFEQVRELDPGSQPSFLDAACGDDPSLRSEVEMLLSGEQLAGSFIQSPPFEAAASVVAEHHTGLLAGQVISHYRIVSSLGSGGMGEVYLAEDLQLKRRVAVKFLRPESAGDERAARRLIREAQAIATLDHPNICSVYEVGRQDSLDYIVMQYIEGKTLAALIQQKQPDLQESLDIAIQVADALAEAHSRGIIHRDIKPQNIMITPRGQAKVLDFGLAKLLDTRGQKSGAETISALHTDTDPGAVMGTATYMSPEQARGQVLDARTDIFSFGVVLYEMIAGRAPFQGPSISQVIAAILETQPAPLSLYAPLVPPQLQHIIDKALSKDAEKRYRSIGEMAGDLNEVRRILDSGTRLTLRAWPKDGVSAGPGMIPNTGQARLGKYWIPGAAAVLVVAPLVYYLVEHRHKSLNPGSKPMTSLAVVPFKPLSPGMDGESLGLGLAEDLVTRLASTRQIVVSPTSSVARLAGRGMEPADIGRALGVDAVLTGTVQRAEDRIRFDAQLVRTEDRTPVWADKFDESAADILTVQDRLSQRLAQALALQLSGEQQRRLTKNYTTDAEAFQLYMKGDYYWRKRTREGFNVCADYLQQALRKDPEYALAYAGLAATYSSQSQLGYAAPNEAMPLAKAAVMKALDIDDTLPNAHVVLATIKSVYDLDFAGGEKEFQRAMELDSNYLEAHQYYALLCLAAMGRFAECRSQLEQAQKIDPEAPLLETTTTFALYLAGNYDDVIARCKRAIEVNPNFYLLHLHLGQALAAKGLYDQAISAFQKARIASGDAPAVLGRLGYSYAASGRKQEARMLLQELQKASAQPHYIAQIYIGLDEPDRAIESLQEASRERSGDLIYLNTDPIYGPLRSDPKFIALLELIGFRSRSQAAPSD